MELGLNGKKMTPFEKKKRVISLAILVVAIVVSAYLVFLSISKSYREQQIFCEGGLTKDMSTEDAIDYLQGFGNITYKFKVLF